VLVLAVVPATLVAVVLVSYFTKTRLHDLERALEDRGEAISRHLAPASEYGVYSGNVEFLRRLAQTALDEPDVVRVSIYTSAGQLLVETRRIAAELGASDEPPLLFSADIVGDTVVLDDPVSLESAGQALQSAAPAVLGRVQVEMSKAATNDRQWEVVVTSLALTLGCLGLGVVYGTLLGRKVSGPILRMEAAVADLRQGKLDVRIRQDSPGELGSLERGICVMAHELRESREVLQQRIEQATAELLETMEELEIKNVELDIARKKAIEASRIKSEFLANVSHEIRTPMNGILGFIELLESTNLDRTQQAYLQTVRSSAGTLLALVNDILDLSKIEAGKLRLRSESFELREVLENSVILYSAMAHAKGLKLSLDLWPQLPVRVVGDAQRLSQIVVNLVSNALKFTERGEVEVSAQAESVGAGGVNLVLSVRDTGIGIGDEDRERLFAAFTQVDSSVGRRHAGTGLGLTISKGLAAMMDGVINFVSLPGRGSTFTLSLPLKPDLQWQEPLRHVGDLAQHQVILFSTHRALARSIGHILQASRGELSWIEQRVELDARLESLAGDANARVSLLLDAAQSGKQVNGALTLIAEFGLSHCLNLVVIGRHFGNDDVWNWPEGLRPHCQVERPPRARDLLACLIEPGDMGPAGDPGEGPHPSHSEAPTGADTTPGSRAEAGVAKVLLADDNPVNRRLASLFLDQMGLKVLEVTDGEAAVEACEHTCYNLVLMDVHMPNMDGLEATRRIRALSGPSAGVPIIALTADAMRDDREHYLRSGMDDYLAKPFTREELEAIVQRWVNGRIDVDR
jgi:two-component system sensor histidine kinase BarA